MKNFVCLVMLCLCYITGFSQSNPPKFTVKGIIIDSAKNEALGYATVALRNAKTNQPVKSTLSKDNGSFELAGITRQPLQLVVASVGFKNKIIAITDTTQNEIDLGKILIAPATNNLKEVAVTALKPLIKREVDRISYDIQADPDSKVQNVLDMLRKVPLLSVDGSDNIKLKGAGNYKILINNKESSLVARNPSDVFKSMPASNIERIEVITTPPAKYDAEGLAGIINIITKKNADQGYNVTTTLRENTVYGPGVNLNATVKQGKFGVSGYTGYSRRNRQQVGFNSERVTLSNPNMLPQTITSTLLQQGTNTYGDGHNVYGSAEVSYELDTLNLFTANYEHFNGSSLQQNAQTSDQRDSTNSTNQFYRLFNDGRFKYNGTDLGFNYQHNFAGKKDQLLTASYKYSHFNFNQISNASFSERLNYPQLDYRQPNTAGNNEHTVQVDYVHPLKKLTIEGGAKAILRSNFSEYAYEQRAENSPDYVNVPSLTNNFKYHQDVYSVYNTYQLKLEKWTAKAGLRLENTRVDADFTSSASSVSQNYFNLVPSVSVQRTLKSSSVNFGFTQRIQRPGIWELNPFIDRTNPKYITTGNQNLRPVTENNFELNYSRFGKGSINVGLSYAFANNTVENISIIRPDTVTFSQPQNIGRNKNLGLNTNFSYPITPKTDFSINGQISHIWLQGYYNGQLNKNDGFQGNVYLNASQKFGHGWRAGISGGYYSPYIGLQTKSNPYVFSSYSASKELWDKKLTISFAANNPYSKFIKLNSKSFSPQFRQNTYNESYYRTFNFSVTYKFGKLNGGIKKNQRGISNDDVKSGGKG
ncbi:TonB-dependent receptor [Mucilaginibacter sp. Bleaf8]|uniref:outer membrane beta-barrel family protein n=1 Tax=Mucilaginibacter sp. Bleaf8 TaxID=2834430 RepID=UPI001BCF7587|nr:outer membrane beta-barrel family protein [Mucilaginibacter sp. Bleaf8]MBS7564043.1 TonB-dependent receptor [Mucilaginibacter sp. Bleaf8]